MTPTTTAATATGNRLRERGRPVATTRSAQAGASANRAPQQRRGTVAPRPRHLYSENHHVVC